MDFACSPCEHPRILFLAPNEPDVILLAAGAQLIGAVNPFEACAAKSTIDGDLKAIVQKSTPATFTVVAKDKEGKTITSGGDAICATWSHKPAKAGDFQDIDVKDNGDGRYDVTCRPPCAGEYVLEVFINGAKLSHTLSVTCEDGWFHFEGEHCQAENTISPDKQAVSHTGRQGVWASVLGSRGLRQGRHSWKVKVQNSRASCFFIGVAEKDKLADTLNYNQSYSWQGFDGRKRVMGSVSDSINRFQLNDVLQVDLDCDSHNVQIINYRAGQLATIDDLPAAELVPYFATHCTNDSLILVW